MIEGLDYSPLIYTLLVTGFWVAYYEAWRIPNLLSQKGKTMKERK